MQSPVPDYLTEALADVALVVVAVVATFVMMLALSSWVGISGIGSATWLKRLLPGESATELVVGAWVVLAVLLAPRRFRGEPRR